MFSGCHTSIVVQAANFEYDVDGGHPGNETCPSRKDVLCLNSKTSIKNIYTVIETSTFYLVYNFLLTSIVISLFKYKAFETLVRVPR